MGSEAVEVDMGDGKPVNITVENGGVCNVNIEITNCYNNTYRYPEGFTLDALKTIVSGLRG